MKRKAVHGPGFTLIELLIVVAIIGILAAIAVPNFLNARMRAKITLVVGNMQTFTTANEMYRVDRNTYLLGFAYGGGGWNNYRSYNDLTTPIAYLSSVDLVEDPFAKKDKSSQGGNTFDQKFEYTPKKFGQSGDPKKTCDMWIIECVGPDGVDSYGSPKYPVPQNTSQPEIVFYQSSNGLISSGDIFRAGGQMAEWMQNMQP